MGLLQLLNDDRFNNLFSVILGVGLICILRPMCSGDGCKITKPPAEKDFDKYVYRMSGNKCYEFKTEIVDCPSSGTIEAFRECPLANPKVEDFRDQFARRSTPIKRCE